MTPTDTLREAVLRAWLGLLPDANVTGHSQLPRVDAALSAIEAAGWLVVPVEPTEPMRFAGGTVCEQIMFEGHPLASGVIFDDMAIVYTAMLTAAPRLDATVRSGEEG